MRFRLVQELAADGVRVAVACRMLGVSSSGYYEQRGRPPSARALADQALTVQIKEIHTFSRGAYGAPLIHNELRLGRDVRCGRKRVARLMKGAAIAGVHRRRFHVTTVRDPDATPAPDLVKRDFTCLALSN